MTAVVQNCPGGDAETENRLLGQLFRIGGDQNSQNAIERAAAHYEDIFRKQIRRLGRSDWCLVHKNDLQDIDRKIAAWEPSIDNKADGSPEAVSASPATAQQSLDRQFASIDQIVHSNVLDGAIYDANANTLILASHIEKRSNGDGVAYLRALLAFATGSNPSITFTLAQASRAQIDQWLAQRRSGAAEKIGVKVDAADYFESDGTPNKLGAELLSSLDLSPNDANRAAGSLGVTVALDSEQPGLFVLKVAPGSPAKKIGLVRGDQILDVDGVSALTPEELRTTLRHKGQGARVALTIRKRKHKAYERLTILVDLAPIPTTVNWLDEGSYGFSRAVFLSQERVKFVRLIDALAAYDRVEKYHFVDRVRRQALTNLLAASGAETSAAPKGPNPVAEPTIPSMTQFLAVADTIDETFGFSDQWFRKVFVAKLENLSADEAFGEAVAALPPQIRAQAPRQLAQLIESHASASFPAKALFPDAGLTTRFDVSFSGMTDVTQPLFTSVAAMGPPAPTFSRDGQSNETEAATTSLVRSTCDKTLCALAITPSAEAGSISDQIFLLRFARGAPSQGDVETGGDAAASRPSQPQIKPQLRELTEIAKLKTILAWLKDKGMHIEAAQAAPFHPLSVAPFLDEARFTLQRTNEELKFLISPSNAKSIRLGFGDAQIAAGDFGLVVKGNETAPEKLDALQIAVLCGAPDAHLIDQSIIPTSERIPAAPMNVAGIARYACGNRETRTVTLLLPNRTADKK
ncbi:hypothetical protein GGD83_004679 [Rhodoblastus sphagnicola]|uniref:PDZ domain-containing protein n=1 Tax=Rhodoblastus sphagnicola TaxID=333368 RepID=UPI001304DC6F|nr:PDZ domain-containing protein [Rhodoblastus sphagnicola]MBB4200850.1 hypothetical protein [Rhodoblastus sphagnicola]